MRPALSQPSGARIVSIEMQEIEGEQDQALAAASISARSALKSDTPFSP